MELYGAVPLWPHTCISPRFSAEAKEALLTIPNYDDLTYCQVQLKLCRYFYKSKRARELECDEHKLDSWDVACLKGRQIGLQYGKLAEFILKEIGVNTIQKCTQTENVDGETTDVQYQNIMDKLLKLNIKMELIINKIDEVETKLGSMQADIGDLKSKQHKTKLTYANEHKINNEVISVVEEKLNTIGCEITCLKEKVMHTSQTSNDRDNKHTQTDPNDNVSPEHIVGTMCCKRGHIEKQCKEFMTKRRIDPYITKRRIDHNEKMMHDYRHHREVNQNEHRYKRFGRKPDNYRTIYHNNRNYDDERQHVNSARCRDADMSLDECFNRRAKCFRNNNLATHDLMFANQHHAKRNSKTQRIEENCKVLLNISNTVNDETSLFFVLGVNFPKTWNKGIHLGAGSFGKVYLVVDKDRPEDELFVVKEVQLGQSNKSEHLVDFKKETEILFLLRDHHRIVPYFGYSITDIAASIFMGYMKQGSLSLYSKANKLSEVDCFVFIQQILEGLEYLHKQNVIHRDVKGANILLETKTRIRLTDFGVSKVISDITDKHTLEVGSWRWMAPEVCNEELNDESYSFEADSWSLGCTVIEMITGDHPYRSLKKTTSVILKVGNGEPPDLPDCISERMKHFLTATFEKRQQQRLSAKKLLEHFFCKGSLNEYPERSEISQCTTSLQDIQCTNNPGHSSFTSIQTLTALHLSEHNLPDEVFQCIKSIVELTVQINVHSTSLNRPDHWPDSSYSYPYYNMRGSTETRYGSGMVYSVTLHTDDNDKCPCQKCFMSKEPSKFWGIMDIMTATHVVFDVEEAKKSHCRFFFDDVNSEEIIVNGFRLVTADVNKNWCLLRCITCDDNILKRVNREMLKFDSFLQNCNDNLRTECNSYGFIVSHPHGGPKQVSFGKMETRKILDQTWSQLTYTMSTCPGSSGAYVYIVGESGKVWHYPHVHSGAFSSGLNYSSVGYYGTKELSKATDHCEFPKDESKNDKLQRSIDMTFQSIATLWGKGEVLWRGKFSRVYPLIDLCQISKQFIIIKEEILPEDSIKCQQILNAYKNEHEILQTLDQHGGIIIYHGYKVEVDRIMKFLNFMPLGSMCEYYQKNGPISEDKCLLFTLQILEGLEYLHQNNVIHMDIRAKNILIETEQRVRISGFECSRKVSQIIQPEEPCSLRWTAPELINPDFGDGMFGVQVDIWLKNTILSSTSLSRLSGLRLVDVMPDMRFTILEKPDNIYEYKRYL
ncbi:hypothetical protein Btru_075526 [Bulinus truncatus]|nr:hypothetical protein Btru_075526 [Bulinus truncatus]